MKTPKTDTKRGLKAYRVLLLILFSGGLLYSQTEVIGKKEIQHLRWGGVTEGWKQIYSLRDVELTRNPMGRFDVILAENSPTEDENTDLLIHFDTGKRDTISFVSENYETYEVNIFPSEEIRKYGRYAAGFFNYRNSVKLKPLRESIFYAEGMLASFAIDFYLYPISIHDDITVLSWHAPVVEMDGAFTGMKAYFRKGRLTWEFENIFKDNEGRFIHVIIEENERTPINQWHHHSIFYNAKQGLLTLFYDGRESNIRWLTESEREGATLLKGNFSSYLLTPFTIGERFLGYIDDFRISRDNPRFTLDEYKEYGEIKSDLIQLEGKGTKLVNVSWESIEKMGTAVRVYCRMSMSYFPPYGESESISGVPRWIQVMNGTEVKDTDLMGKYIQWKAELYGTGGEHTPSLLSLDLALELDPAPMAPIILRSVPIDGGVVLEWSRNKENDIQGYKVYYGDSSNHYFGKGSDRGDSPLFVGNINRIVLHSLENEKVYFFSITAVDNADQESGFSNEVIVRPSSIYGDE